MSPVVTNLRRARKSKARAEKEARAEHNRIVFGRTKTQRRQDEANKQLQEKRLDSMMISPNLPTPDPKD
ncbi:MAG: DUF4169 family protein [Hyphomicrobiaceae bacterium]